MNTTSRDRRHIEAELLATLGLQRTEPPPALAPEFLTTYTGTYRLVEGTGGARPVVIRLQDDTLSADLYWENGCALRPQGPDQFRLDANNRVVQFQRDAVGHVTGFEYRHWQGVQVYVRDPFP